MAIEWVMPIGTLGAAALIIATVPWWLSSKFNEMRKEFTIQVQELGDRILDKMEYHERHDDARFNNINNDIIAIKIRNATIDGNIRASKEKGSNGTL